MYLNVYTPYLPGAGVDLLLPVIVWFHGGAFCVGSNESKLYGPDLLLDHGVVLVTVNYRLGIFGFFNLESPEAPGNQGMLDQVLALKWVRDHIRSFGGNPGNVTIMGESAGAMSSFLHLASPLSQGLFHKLIAMSGSPSTPFLHNDRKSIHYSKALANHLLKKKLAKKPPAASDDHEAILTMLKQLPAKTIVEATCLFKDWDVANPMPWKPGMDGHAGQLAFMPRLFDEAIKAGLFNKDIPVMAGCVTEEGLIFSSQFYRSPRRWRMLFNDWDHWSPQLLFNRETDLVSLDDICKVNMVRQKFFPSDHGINDNVPVHKGTNIFVIANNWEKKG